MSTDLIDEIDAFLAERKIGDHRFGVLATNNGRLLERLRSGGRIWPETADKIRQFIRSERQALSVKKGTSHAPSTAPVSQSDPPEVLQSGKSGAQFVRVDCAPVAVSGEVSQ